MNKQIPKKEDYSEPILSIKLQCLNCDYIGIEVRALIHNLRKIYCKHEENFAYLCPKCFKQLILRNDKEKVIFT